MNHWRVSSGLQFGGADGGEVSVTQVYDTELLWVSWRIQILKNQKHFHVSLLHFYCWSWKILVASLVVPLFGHSTMMEATLKYFVVVFFHLADFMSNGVMHSGDMTASGFNIISMFLDRTCDKFSFSNFFWCTYSLTHCLLKSLG